MVSSPPSRSGRMKPWYSRRAIWRLAVGPLRTGGTAGALLLFARSGIRIPAPGAFMLGTIFVSSCIGGVVAGYLSAVVSIGCMSALLSEPALSFTPDREFRLHLIVTLGLVLPLLVSHLRKRTARRLEAER